MFIEWHCSRRQIESCCEPRGVILKVNLTSLINAQLANYLVITGYPQPSSVSHRLPRFLGGFCRSWIDAGALRSKSASNSSVQLSANAMFSRLVRLTSPEVSKRLILASVTPDLVASERRDRFSASRCDFAFAAIALRRSTVDRILIGNILSLYIIL